MSDEAPRLKLVYSRPTAWIADATLADTRAYVERFRKAWLSPAVPVPVYLSVPERAGDDAGDIPPRSFRTF